MSIKGLIEKIDSLEKHISRLRSMKHIGSQRQLANSYYLSVKLHEFSKSSINGLEDDDGFAKSVHYEILEILIKHHDDLLDSCKERLTIALKPQESNNDTTR